MPKELNQTPAWLPVYRDDAVVGFACIEDGSSSLELPADEADAVLAEFFGV